MVEKLEEAMGEFLVSGRFRNVGDNFEWTFTGVYGPNVDREKRLMWEELAGLYSLWNLPWCVGGDFNAIHFPSEYLGAEHFPQGMYNFSDFISINGLWICLWRVVATLGQTLCLALR